MNRVPVITIFVRHSEGCPQADEPFSKKCSCWKHLRWTHDVKQHFKATHQKTWAGAERAQREMEDSFERAGRPELSEAMSVGSAVDTSIKSKKTEGVGSAAMKKYQRELEEFLRLCEVRGCVLLVQVKPEDLVDFASG